MLVQTNKKRNKPLYHLNKKSQLIYILILVQKKRVTLKALFLKSIRHEPSRDFYLLIKLETRFTLPI
jgi:hypothetical protein